MNSADLKTDRPHPARIYDYLLGGKDNFEADRSAAAQTVQVWPSLPISMRANRDFMTRVTRYLAQERGIRQFLDVGTGLPTSPNLHDVAQQVDPASRVVYVDNDPIVLVHARALLTGTPEGKVRYISADLRNPEAILEDDALKDTLDLSRPVAVTLIAILHYIVDEDEAHSIIDRLMAPMPAGSALAVSTATADTNPAEVEAGLAVYNKSGIASKARTKAEVEGLFRGLEPVGPGVALVHRWPDDDPRSMSDRQVQMWGGVAIKP